MKAYLRPPTATIGALESVLDDWGLDDDDPVLWEAWKMFDRTNGTVLPEAGGYLDQDQRVMRFFDRMYQLKAFHQIPDQPGVELGNTW